MTAVADGHRVSVKPRLAVLAWSVGAVSVAGFAATWVLAAGNRDLFDLSAVFGPDRFMVAYAVIGAILASRRPANPIGWLLLGIGLACAARALAGQYALHALSAASHPASAVWAAWYVNWALTLLFPGGLLMFLLLLFPTGRALSPRWRAVGWLAVGFGMISGAPLAWSRQHHPGIEGAQRAQPDRHPGLGLRGRRRPPRQRRLGT